MAGSNPSSVWQSEAQGYIGLERGGMVVLAVRLIAPVADGFLRSRSEDGIPAESANFGDGAIFGYQDLENYVAGAAGRAFAG